MMTEVEVLEELLIAISRTFIAQIEVSEDNLLRFMTTNFHRFNFLLLHREMTRFRWVIAAGHQRDEAF